MSLLRLKRITDMCSRVQPPNVDGELIMLNNEGKTLLWESLVDIKWSIFDSNGNLKPYKAIKRGNHMVSLSNLPRNATFRIDNTQTAWVELLCAISETEDVYHRFGIRNDGVCWNMDNLRVLVRYGDVTPTIVVTLVVNGVEVTCPYSSHLNLVMNAFWEDVSVVVKHNVLQGSKHLTWID